MAGKRPSGNPVAVSDLATGILDPMLRKRAGISVGLVQSWEEIVGPRVARLSRPERIQWPRRLHEDDPFEPAVLVIACEGVAALHIQHHRRGSRQRPARTKQQETGESTEQPQHGASRPQPAGAAANGWTTPFPKA